MPTSILWLLIALVVFAALLIYAGILAITEYRHRTARQRSIGRLVLALILLAPAAHAQTMDPTTQSALTWLFSFLPHPYDTYAASVLGILGILSFLASAIAAKIKPPSAEAASWLRTVYAVVTWPALNFGWARNAVVPGAPLVVQQAMKEAAVLAAAMPEAQVVAPMPSPSGAPVIVAAVPGAPA